MSGDTSPARPFNEMQDEGLLWLINRVVFHPRGYALAFHKDEDGSVSGWSMLGNGSKVWRFHLDDDEECFAKAETFLAGIVEHSGLEEATP